MTPQIINRDEFIVVGVRTVVELGAPATGTLWKDEFLPRHSELKGADRRYYGVFSALSSDKNDGRYEYVAGMAANSLEDIPVGMVGWVVPAGKYAEVSATGLTGIYQACRNTITDWVPDSGYKVIATPMFAYTDSPQPDSPDTTWKVNIPVETPERLAQLESWLS